MNIELTTTLTKETKNSNGSQASNNKASRKRIVASGDVRMIIVTWRKFKNYQQFSNDHEKEEYRKNENHFGPARSQAAGFLRNKRDWRRTIEYRTGRHPSNITMLVRLMHSYWY